MYDLIYCETREEYDTLVKKLLIAFPLARIHDGSDEIHPHRFSIEMDRIAEPAYRSFLSTSPEIGSLMLATEGY